MEEIQINRTINKIMETNIMDHHIQTRIQIQMLILTPTIIPITILILIRTIIQIPTLTQIPTIIQTQTTILITIPPPISTKTQIKMQM